MVAILRQGSIRDMQVNVKCHSCGAVQQVMVAAQDYRDWQGGTHAQNVFPYLNADDRELLISHTCAACWKKMFGEEDDD